MNRKYLYSLFLILLSLWWGWTIIVDMIVVPTTFSIIKDFFNAGDLGIAVFSKLNRLEVIVSTALVILTALHMKKRKATWPLLALSLIGFFITLFYFSYLIPKITTLTNLWKDADMKGVSHIAGLGDIQQEHQFFHKLYIQVDTLKLAILSLMLFLGIYKEEKWV